MLYLLKTYINKYGDFAELLQKQGMEELIKDYIKKAYTHTGMDFRNYPKNDN